MQMNKRFVENIRQLIVAARGTVARGVDLVQVQTNFEIGRRIVEEEQRGMGRAGYGEEIIKALAGQLSKDFGRGLSARNLAYMRTFYQLCRDRLPILQTVSAKSTAPGNLQSLTAKSNKPEILQTVSAKSGLARISQTVSGQLRIAQTMSGQLAATDEIPPRPFTLSWSHYVFLMSIENPAERSFYEIEATNEDWTLRGLKRQFDSSLYERLALSRDKEGIRRLAREGQTVAAPQDLLKDPLVLEFLGLEERTRYSESDLEAAIIERIGHFLLELGKGFLFEARQRRFAFDGEHYFVDLVFYNRLLRCYVLIDLKLGRLTHQDLGQMQMYVNYFDRHEKTAGENDTVGIVLCKQKNRTLVEITLPKGAHIHAPEYRLYLPGKDELRKKLQEWSGDAEQAARAGRDRTRSPKTGRARSGGRRRTESRVTIAGKARK